MQASETYEIRITLNVNEKHIYRKTTTNVFAYKHH